MAWPTRAAILRPWPIQPEKDFYEEELDLPRSRAQRSFELWVTETISAQGKRELHARGFTVVEQDGGGLAIVD